MKKSIVFIVLLSAFLGGCVVVPAGPGYGHYHRYDGPMVVPAPGRVEPYRGYGPGFQRGYERGYDRGYRGW